MKWKIEKRVNIIKDNVRRGIQELREIGEEDKLTINLYYHRIIEHWNELYVYGIVEIGEAELVKGNHKHIFFVSQLWGDLSVRVYEIQQYEVEN